MQEPDVKLPRFLLHATRLAGVSTVVFIVWASLANVDEAVKGFGRTVSSGQNKVIQHLEGGIVSDILVKEGEIVEKNQVMLRVQNVGMASTMRENSVKQRSLQAALVRLKAEVEDTELAFPKELEASAPEEVANERRQYEARKSQRFEALRIIEDQINQKQRSLEELTSKVGNLKRELATAVEQYGIVAGLQKAGATSANRMLDARAKVNRFTTELSTAEQTIPITQAELSETQGKLEETRARLRNEILEEMRKATLESTQLAERLKADADRMQRTDVNAPVKGVVNRLYVHTIGGTVRPGETLAELTPMDEGIIVEAKIAPEHRAKIWVGQDVKVKVTAFEYATYGTVPGSITDISADSFADEQSKNPYYRIRVTLGKTELNDAQRIMPGMLTEVNILTGKRTVMDYLLRPLIRVKEDAFRE